MWLRRTYRRRIIPSVLLAALLIVPSLGPPPAHAAPKRITQVIVKDFSSKLVVGIVSTGQILYHVLEISAPAPPRVAIDLLDSVVGEPLRMTTEVNKGSVLRVRVGQFQDSPAIARVVIDLMRPTPVEVERTAPNILAVGVPMQPVTEAEARQAARAPVPVRPPLAPTAAVAPSAGVVQTAQQPTTLQPPGLIKLLEFRAVALSDVLSALAKLCGFNLVTDSSVQGTVTLRLVDVTCEDAFRFILEANNLGFRRLGRNIIVSSAEKLAPPPEVPETVTYRLAFGDVNQVRAAVAAAVPGIRVAVDPRTNSMLVTGTAAQQEEVLKVLASVDVKIPQVVIQVHAVDINTNVLRELGLFSGLADQPFGQFFLDSALNRISFQLLDRALILFRLQALVTESKARVLSAPRIAVLDGNKATILVGEKRPIFTATTQAGVTTTTVTFIDVGVKLEVTPRVNTEGLITLSIKPEVSRVLAIETVGTQSAPRVGTRSADTTLTVKDGETLVLGGLISQEERRTTLKVPLLGDIPILGELFRRTRTEIDESEVIFLITPQVVKDGTP